MDVGGTFTDLVFYDGAGRVHCFKVPSTPHMPGLSSLHGLDEIRASLSISADAWEQMSHTHSSTVATNALIERRGARLGLLVTAGFRDLFEIQRLAVPNPVRFDSRRPLPLVRRALIREVAERIDARGVELQPLDREAVAIAGEELQVEGVEILLVCFLHSYRNPRHEVEAREVLQAGAPSLPVELSSEVWPQAREYERATLTAVNAYVRPIVQAYVSELEAGIADRGLSVPPRASRSNGGMELLESLSRRPVVALLSGPAAGVSGAVSASLAAGWRDADLVTLDVGGTSADIGVVRAGRPVLSSEEHIADFPLLTPTVAVSSIGAGGGSIVWVDEAGSLKIGPESVGAVPGPACYGSGESAVPALTDAMLITGLLRAGQRLGNKIPLRPEPARRALAGVADRLALRVEEVADGAVQIAIAMMAAEATNVLARRGVDAPNHRLVAYGGAGPLVAALVAEEIYVQTVLVPPRPGTLSALGAATANLEGDFIEPVYCPLARITADELRGAKRRLDERVESWLDAERQSLPVNLVSVEYSADMRYDGQSYDVSVAVQPELLLNANHHAVALAFEQAHREAYGHADEDGLAWMSELRAHVVGVTPKPVDSVFRPDEEDAALAGTRWVRLKDRRFEVQVVHRSLVSPGAQMPGPAIVEQMDTTTFVPDGWEAAALASGSLLLTRRSS